MNKWSLDRQAQKRSAAAINVNNKRGALRAVKEGKSKRAEKMNQSRKTASDAFAAIVAKAGSNKQSRRERVASMWSLAA